GEQEFLSQHPLTPRPPLPHARRGGRCEQAKGNNRVSPPFRLPPLPLWWERGAGGGRGIFLPLWWERGAGGVRGIFLPLWWERGAGGVRGCWARRVKGLHHLGESPVHDLDFAKGTHHHIAGLEVLMNHSLAVSKRDRLADLLEDTQ